ncbi:hypothetical protein [Thalassobium sp. R2A62]|uniref:hypothetical protein n=1 Tax=Thalassobium sp. R2A62 TaxID=633131 RepID=UPI0001B1CC95|nr:hypothetical protein [Thalassobium sp. R2A62]EET47714.1 hypothetical protein TR2A62_3593 [Thalassobium sp. R2A62]
MGYKVASIASKSERASLENALLYIAKAIVLENGDVYLPLFEKLECALNSLSERETTIERARRIAQEARAA